MRLTRIIENGGYDQTQNFNPTQDTKQLSNNDAIAQIIAMRDQHQNSKPIDDRIKSVESIITTLARELQSYKSDMNAGLRAIAQNFQKTNNYIEQLAKIQNTTLQDEEDDPDSWVDL